MQRNFTCVVIGHVSDDRATVERLQRLAGQLQDVRFIAVGDSPSAALAVSACTAALSNVTYVHLDLPLGKGAALRSGFNAAQLADIVAFVDLGGDVAAADIRKFVALLADQHDVDGVIGDRFASVPEAQPPRSLAGRCYGLFARAIFGLTVSDTQAPLKVFRRAAVAQLFEDLRLYDHGFDVELLFQAERHGLNLASRPMQWTPGPRTWPLLRTAVHAMLALLFVRALHSPAAKIPFVDLLGRKYHLPAKRSYSIMLFCWRDPKSPLAGGGEAYLYEQAKCWVNAGHAVTWFAQQFDAAPREEVLDGISIVRRGRFPWVFGLAALWYTLRSGHGFDFIVDCMNGIPFFTPLFSTKPKVCLVYHIHSHHFKDELPPGISQLASAIETKLVPFVYRRTPFLTISENTRAEMIAARMSAQPIQLVYCGVSSDMRAGVKSPVPTIAHVGRLKKYKGVRDLIDSFVEIKRHVHDARLVIAGAGDDEPALRMYAATTNVEGIEFLGRIDEDAKVRLLQEAWVFGMPSRIEGWGIVVIEANACGTPAVAYNVSALRDCVVHERTGLLAETHEEFTQHLLRILQDGQLRSQMSADALEWSAKFSWAASAERTLDIIRRSQRWRAVFELEGAGPEYWKLQIPELSH